MSPAFSTRRHADDFDRLVEAARRGTPAAGPVPAELAELATFATRLSETPAVAPRAAFSADLRERLMAAAATELTPAAEVNDRLTVRSNPATRRRHERRLTVGIASIAIVGASAGTALASQGALPGEPLYPVKRAIENVRTGFTPGDSGKGSALLSDADNRLSEVSKLSHGSDNSSQITATLDAFAEQAKKASDLLLTNYQQNNDPASIQKLQQFTSDSIDQLTALEPLLPDSAKQSLTDAAQTVLMIDTAAHNACPSCGGNSITSLPESLLNPVSQTLDSLTTSLKAPKPSATKSQKPTISLPSVPANLGPANVAPSDGPATTAPSKKPSSGTKTDPLDPIKKLLQPSSSSPSSKPSSLGDVVQGVTDGLNDTVGGVLGSVDGVVGGLLGGNKTTGP